MRHFLYRPNVHNALFGAAAIGVSGAVRVIFHPIIYAHFPPDIAPIIRGNVIESENRWRYCAVSSTSLSYGKAKIRPSTELKPLI